jgi:hypothetical protein
MPYFAGTPLQLDSPLYIEERFNDATKRPRTPLTVILNFSSSGRATVLVLHVVLGNAW